MVQEDEEQAKWPKLGSIIENDDRNFHFRLKYSFVKVIIGCSFLKSHKDYCLRHYQRVFKLLLSEQMVFFKYYVDRFFFTF